MEILSSFGLGIITFIVLLVPLMIVHELGHFWAAKRAGIRVEEFGLGLPPRAVKLFERDGTIYSLNWLPLGAFVRLFGEGVDDDMDDPASFSRASAKWRFITILAGPVMNFVAALAIVFSAYLFFATKPAEVKYTISAVGAGSFAESLGLKPNDVIVSANGVDVRRLTDEAPATGNRATPLTLQARQSIGKPFTINVERDGKSLELKGDMPATANANAPLGINLSIDVTKMLPANYGVIGSARNTVEDLTGAMVAMVRVPIEIIRGALPISQARPVGIVGITQIGVSLVKQAPQNGPFQFVWFAGILSMLIGLTNLLPFPALDGGRLTFIIIEWIRGKRVDPKREQWVHALGMTFLLGVFVLITALDIFSPVVR